MSLFYKVAIAAPSTATTRAQSFTWTPDSEVVEAIELDLHKEHKHISTLNVRLHDPRQGLSMWPIYNALPDPSFADVPVQLYLANPNKGPSSTTLVFDGKIGSYQPGYPADSHTTVIAHDRSLSARLQARYKAYHGKTGVQLAQQIASDYGYSVDTTALAGLVLTQRAIDLGMSTVGLGAFSDWNHLVRALAVDGLEFYLKGKTIYVRQNATAVYPTTFSPDDGNVISLDVQTNHVSSPGAGGQAKTPVPGGNKGSINSAQGNVALENIKEGATAVTHRTPPQGPKQGHNAAHTESSRSLTAYAGQRRKRKDEATLTLRLTPDIGMQHLIALKGWGLKIDGNWYIESIHHSITGNAGQTQLHLTTVPTTGSQKQAGIPQPGASKT